MHKLVLLVLILFGVVSGQEKFIALKREPITIANRNFYIKDIADSRPNRAYVGFSRTGFLNKNVLVKFKPSVKQELLNYFRDALPPKPKQTPVILQLLVLRVSEKTSAFSEKAKAEAKLAFYIERDGKWGKVYETAAVHESEGTDATKLHERSLRIVLGQCLQAFANSRWETAPFTDANIAPLAAKPVDTTKTVLPPSISGELVPSETQESSSENTELQTRKYSFGIGGIGAMQQNKFPLDFGTGMRFFFGAKDMRRLNTEVAIDYVLARNLSNGLFFAFGNTVTVFAFSQARQLNLDLTGKIALGSGRLDFPYFLINLGATKLLATNAQSLTLATGAFDEAKASVSGIYFGAGLGYKYYVGPRLFFDINGSFNFVLINSASGGNISDRLQKSISAKAQLFKAQLGHEF